MVRSWWCYWSHVATSGCISWAPTFSCRSTISNGFPCCFLQRCWSLAAFGCASHAFYTFLCNCFVPLVEGGCRFPFLLQERQCLGQGDLSSKVSWEDWRCFTAWSLRLRRDLGETNQFAVFLVRTRLCRGLWPLSREQLGTGWGYSLDAVWSWVWHSPVLQQICVLNLRWIADPLRACELGCFHT